MNDFKTFIVYAIGGIATLLAPIQNFIYAMLLLFGINFIFGLVAAIVKDEEWDTKKALWFFVYVAIFLFIVATTFLIGHLMGEHEQAVVVVKVLCYIAVYIFGTNIFRNLRKIVPYGSTWYKFFDLCYYTMSIKFIEKFDFVKKWREDEEKKNNHNTILDKDDF